METVNVFLSTAQLRKMNAGKPFQLSATQLHAGEGKHHVAISLNKTHYNKLMRNVNHHKGFRFTPEIVQGGSLLSDFGNYVKNYVKEHAGSAVERVKKMIPRGAAKAAANAAVKAIAAKVGKPQYGDSAAHLVDSGVDLAYNHNFEKPLVGGRIKHMVGQSDSDEEEGGRLARATSVARRVKRSATGRKTMFEGLPNTVKPRKIGKLVKGSAEAKAWGERMRQHRGKKMGGDLLDDITNAGNNLGKLFVPVAGVNPFTAGYNAGYNGAAAVDHAINGSGMSQRKHARRVNMEGCALVGGIPVLNTILGHTPTPVMPHFDHVVSSLPKIGGSFIAPGEQSKGGKLKKGTPEMAARMAHLRSLRKK